MRRAVSAAGLVLLSASVVVAVRAPDRSPASTSNRAVTTTPAIAGFPASFIQNAGQVDPSVGFYSRGTELPVSFGPEGPTVAVESGHRGWGVGLRFGPGARVAAPAGADPLATTVSYLRDPRVGSVSVRAYRGVRYGDVWPGIDARFDARKAGAFEYRFAVAPGADPSRIALAYRGATAVRIDRAGRLRVSTPLGELVDAAPAAWQVVGGRRVDVRVAYRTTGPRGFGFDVGGYDHSRRLILDPAVFAYGGYIGGDNFDQINGIAVDGQGAAYVGGYTKSAQNTFPVTVGPNTTKPGDFDGFVAKVAPDGSSLVYAGYIGTSNADSVEAIAVDGSGNAYVGGFTIGSGIDDGFVARVKADGTALDYDVPLNNGEVEGIAVDGSGNAYVTGVTGGGLPTQGGPDLTFNGSSDAFATKLDPTGAIVYSGFIGGSDDETGRGIAVDGAGNAYVTGETLSTQSTFPVSVGPDTTFDGNGGDFFEGFVVEVKADGSGFLYGGYIGGPNHDDGFGIAVDPSGAAYVTGGAGGGLPVVVGPGHSYGGDGDAFVAKVAPGGASFDYLGYVGGTSTDTGRGIAVASDGSAVITGKTISPPGTFPVAGGPDITRDGGSDGFAVKIAPDGTGVSFGTYVGGNGGDQGFGIALDASGSMYVGGDTDSDGGLPGTTGPDRSFNGGVDDGLVAKITEVPCTITGTPGNDTLVGTAGDDIICGGDGNDVLKGGGGDDTLLGGDGNDSLFADAGNDTMDGGAGTDTATFADLPGPVTVDLNDGKATGGGTGTDVVAAEKVIGTAANDTLTGDSNANILLGRGGNDTIKGEPLFSGFGANDVLSGGPGNDTIFGENGADKVRGGAGNDTLHGGLGKDLIVGGKGKDKMFGDQTGDTIKAKDGVNGETVDGGDGHDKCTHDPRDHVTSCP